MKVKLKKIHSTHTRLRTDTVTGESLGLPRAGQRFELISEPLVAGFDARLVSTSPVQTVEEVDGVIRFATTNSIYELEVLS